MRRPSTRASARDAVEHPAPKAEDLSVVPAEEGAAANARMLVEHDLRGAESRNRMLVEQLPQVTYIEQLSGESASYISPQIEELVGYSPREWMADPGFFAKVLHPDDRERVLAGFAEMHESGDRFECEYRLIARDQHVVWVHDGAVVARDDAGSPLYAQGFMVDISGRKATEQALRESEQRFRDLVSGIDVIVWEADQELNFSFVSKRAEDILGYPIERWLREPRFIAGYFHPDDRSRVLAADQAAISDRQDYELEYRVIAADGRTVWFREIVRVEIGDDGAVCRLRGVMVDTTAQKHAEEERAGLEHQLQQSRKMEAVGGLAGGIAHDFNNLLTVISGYTGLAQQKLGDADADAEIGIDLEKIQTATERAAELTQRLLAFGRKQVLTPKVVDLNHTVTDVATLLRRLIGEDIELLTVTAERPLLVDVDPAQFEQVLINLAINARDAMPEGGTLTMSTAACEIDEATAAATPDVHPGAYAMVSVTDTGIGIDDETKPQLFEPFFTTKEVGKGTGLGLASVYGTVRQSDGFITVDSELGCGASFNVFLPLAVDGELEHSNEQVAATTWGNETILLVEDEAAVRDLTKQALELNGYQVIAAATPGEAIQLAAGARYDMLLTDVVMPEMRGGELARRLVAMRPGLKTLFMSGYLDGEALLGEEVPTSFLQKPFSLDELARAVRQLLDG
jgi:two-component system, cell cycle sensor histidine kinase and response regulator CckA